MNDNNIDSYVFSIPINENFNFYNTINSLHDNIINIINTNNSDSNFVQFNIEFEYITPQTEEYNNYFKNCSEINNYLCKAEKIKKEDPLLNEKCFICLDNYEYNQLKRVLPSCKHCFHKKCIDKWLKEKASCPICRDQLLK